jgi:hypothetical protein
MIRQYFALILCFSSLLIQGASYKGRPFVLIDTINNSTPDGFTIRGFSSSQLSGDKVVYSVQDTDFKIKALLSSQGQIENRASPQNLLVGQSTQWPDSEFTFAEFGFNFNQGGDLESDNRFSFTGISNEGSVGLFLSQDESISLLLSSEDTMPASENLHWSRFGEPNYVNKRTAFLGFHRFENDTDFRGVYIYENGSLTRIADSNTELPRGVGKFEGSSSQVGFDGNMVAFWGGPLENNQGMFAAEDADSLRALAVKGDTIPGTGLVIESFMSPPVVDNGTIYFVAFSEGFNSHLLKSSNGELSTVVTHGETTPDGGAFDQIGNSGMVATEGKLYFTATGSPTHVGIYVIEDGVISTVLNNETPFFQRQLSNALILRDAVGDKLLVQNVSRGGRSVSLHATLDTPAVPVILEQPQSILAEPGDDVLFEIKVVGPEEVSYQWTKQGRDIEGATGTSLSLSNVKPEDAANYRVILNFEGVRIFSDNAHLNLNIAPEITLKLEDKSIEAGDPLQLWVTAVGLNPLTYEWTKNGEILPAVIGAQFFKNVAEESDSGIYQVTVRNSLGESVSQAANITVLPPPPNPAYQGRRFTRLAGGDSSIEGADFQLGATSFSDGRVAGDALVFRYFDAIGWMKGLAQLLPNGQASVILSLEDLNQQSGENYTWIENVAANKSSDTFAFMASNSGTRTAGLFLWENGTFTKLADATDPIPGSEGLSVSSFSNAFFEEGRIVFLSVSNNQAYHILEYSEGTLKTIVSPETVLPETGESFLGNLLDFDGSNLLFRSQEGLYQVDANGDFSLIAKKGNPLGDSTISFFGSAAYAPGGIAMLVQDATNNYRLALQKSDGLELLVSKGDFVSDSMTVGFLGGGRVSVLNSDIIVDALLGSARGLLAYTPDGLKPILATRKLDGEAHSNLRLLGANSSNVFFTTEHSNGNSYFYSNAGETVDGGGGPNTDSPTLVYELTEQGLLRFSVPEGFQLQKKTSLLNDTWESLQDQGIVDISTDDASGFFRLHHP